MFGDFNEPKDKFRPTVYPNSGANVSHMRSCGVVGDFTLFCDLSIVETFADKLCNLNLPQGKVKALLNIIPLVRIEHNLVIITDSKKRSIFLS
jgi:hypothetical protein